MSDSVTNVEIEDVLSSIRRLVSVDAAHTGRKTPLGARRSVMQDSAETAGQDNKLVLTADLRVTQPPVNAQPVAPTAAHTAPVSARPIGAEDYTRTLERRIAELEAAVNAQPTEFEPDGSEDTAQHRPTSILRRTRSDAGTASAAGDRSESVEPVADANRDADDAEVLFDLAEADDALQSEDVPEPQDVPEPEAVPDPDATPETDEVDRAEPDGAIDLDALIADEDHPEESEAEDAESAVLSDEDHGPHLTDAIEVDDGFVDIDEPVAQFEILEAETHARSQERDALDDADGFRFDSEDAVIDEETLRDMVAEIVRQELQGALGERITRNVRKLVRREIMRAISIRDFE